jgi:hypothetical protein
MNMAETKRLAVDLEEELHRELKQIAARRGTSLSDIVRRLIADWVKSQAPQEYPRGGRKEPGVPEAAKQAQHLICGTKITVPGDDAEASRGRSSDPATKDNEAG